MVKNIAIGTGRRKTAVARVFVRDGSGKIVVNGKDVKDYFVTEEQIQVVQQPLLVTSMGNKYDILIFGRMYRRRCDWTHIGIFRSDPGGIQEPLAAFHLC